MVTLQGFTPAEAKKDPFGGPGQEGADGRARGLRDLAVARHEDERRREPPEGAGGVRRSARRSSTSAAAPHDFGCATCHGVRQPAHPAAGPSQPHQALPTRRRPTRAWPAYRVSQGELRSFQWRLYDCFRQQRFPELEFASPASVALTMFLAKNANGGVVRRARPSSAERRTTMMKKTKILALAAIAGARSPAAPPWPATRPRAQSAKAAKAVAMMKASFKEHGQAKLDRLDQDEVQRICSECHGDTVIPKDVAARLEKAQQAAIKYPADDKYMGDWKAGRAHRADRRRHAVQRRSDASPTGGNCYACHQLSQGGAVLRHHRAEPVQLRQAARLHAGHAEVRLRQGLQLRRRSRRAPTCRASATAGILTEKQIQDVVALLMDPESPVNK